MKKTVEVTYCDRCSTAIDPDELKVCAGFDLCQPCAAELQIRIKAFVEELKTQLSRLRILQQSRYQYQSLRFNTRPCQRSMAAFCILNVLGAAPLRPFVRRSL